MKNVSTKTKAMMTTTESSEVFLLKTDRVEFAVWSENDLNEANSLWGNLEVTKLIGGPFSNEMILERLNNEVNNFKNFGIQYWKIYLGDTMEFVGCCGLRPYKMEDHVVEFGCHLLPSFWGIGIAYNASLAVIKYGFSHVHATKIFAGHNPNNDASRALLRKLGFSFSHHEFYAPTGLQHPSYFLNQEDVRST